jgi:hypothetical protein
MNQSAKFLLQIEGKKLVDQDGLTNPPPTDRRMPQKTSTNKQTTEDKRHQ